jgi:glycosyltransferase involved in cell wall biosynthesis
MISILTPTYKRNLQSCINCVNWQTYTDWEHIIVSDGPDPELREWLINNNHLSNKRKYYELPFNQGDYGATVRKYAIEQGLVGNQYVAFLDDDNIIFPDFLNEFVITLDGSAAEVGFAICDIIHLGPLPEWSGPAPKVLTGEPVIMGNIDTLQVVVKRDVIEKVGWNSEAGFHSDGATYEELGKKYSYLKINKVLGVHV